MRPRRRKNLITVAALLVLALLSTDVAGQNRGVEVTLRQSETPSAPAADRVTLYGASHALVIGIDRYTGGWPALKTAVSDARQVADELKRQGFNVTLKTDLKSNELREALRAFFAIAGRDPEARLLLWHAGHGTTVGTEGFLVPADAPLGHHAEFGLRALHLREFQSYVRLAKAKHVLSIFDACFAGTIFEARGNPPPAQITAKTAKPVRQFITAGEANQPVRDDGSFREYFLRAIRGDERADFNGDGYVTGEELGLYFEPARGGINPGGADAASWQAARQGFRPG